jgi:hypothetical protein
VDRQAQTEELRKILMRCSVADIHAFQIRYEMVYPKALDWDVKLTYSVI